jgi:hypothetical protein
MEKISDFHSWYSSSLLCAFICRWSDPVFPALIFGCLIFLADFLFPELPTSPPLES